jgi:hypothetical protein
VATPPPKRPFIVDLARATGRILLIVWAVFWAATLVFITVRNVAAHGWHPEDGLALLLLPLLAGMVLGALRWEVAGSLALLAVTVSTLFALGFNPQLAGVQYFPPLLAGVMLLTAGIQDARFKRSRQNRGG